MEAPSGSLPLDYCNDTVYCSWNNTTNLTESDIIENLSEGIISNTIFENKLTSIKTELLNSIDDIFKEEIEKDDNYKNEVKEINETIDLFDQIMNKINKQQNVVLEKEIDYKKQINDTKNDIEKIETFSLFLKDIQKKFQDNDEINRISQDICNLSEKIKNENNCLESRKEYQKELYLLNEYHNLLKKINNGNIGNTCSLCLQNPVNKYLNPCGHTACNECIDNLYERANNQYNVNCFVCRKKVNSNHPIYFI